MRCPRWIVSAASTDTRYDQPVIVHKALDGQEARAILELLHLVRVGPRWLVLALGVTGEGAGA